MQANNSNYYGIPTCLKYFLLVSFFCLLSYVIPVISSSIAEARSETSSARTNSDGGVVPNTVQNINQVIDYLLTLKRSQDEIFRKIDSLTKTVEEKDHEDYKFRLKFSRKVHTLENKVLSLEQDFTQKVEEIVQKKLAERSERHRRDHKSISGSSSISTTVTPQLPSHAHGSSGNNDGGNGNVNIQNHQPSLYLRYQPQPQPYHRNHPHPQLPYQNVHSGGANWGFYEHPITHKKVRSGNLYGFELPTRNLPLISLVATAESRTPLDNNILKGLSPTTPSPSRNQDASILFNDISDEMANFGRGASVGPRVERNGGRRRFEELQKNFESVEATLQTLKGNVTNLEREMARNAQYQSRTDIGEVHKLLVDNAREINVLHQKDQDMIQRMEHFIVEIEKVAAKREHAVNESLREMSAEVKRQVNSLKAYTKRQVQNMTSSSSASNFQSGTPDKLKCAQTLLDELLLQMHPPKSHHQVGSSIQTELIADQAEGAADDDDDRFEKLISYTSSSNKINDYVGVQNADELTKELQLQRKEIMTLKSEMGKLNISQLLLKRTLDEETLKRKGKQNRCGVNFSSATASDRIVRPRDCSEIRLLRNVSSGVYSIFPNKNDIATEVLCDMATDGGGWTVIQRRGESIHWNSTSDSEESKADDRVSFFRNWEDYEKGFGSFDGDFWLGLSTIFSLSQLGIQQLRIELTDWTGETGYANYQYFKISNSSDLYRLQVSGYSGTVGDSLTRHNGMAFSTPDKDNDVDSWRHCARTYFSGWWYYACFESNLNGSYQDKNQKNASYPFGAGIIWQHWKGSHYSLKRVVMKIRNTFIGDNQYAEMFLKA